MGAYCHVQDLLYSAYSATDQASVSCVFNPHERTFPVQLGSEKNFDPGSVRCVDDDNTFY